MAAIATRNGCEIVWDEGCGIWRYPDGEPAEVVEHYGCVKIVWDQPRPCPHCGLLPTPEGHDGCLGHIDGCRAACCGHGVDEPYIVLDGYSLGIEPLARGGA